MVRFWNATEPEWDRDVPWLVRILVRWGIIIVGFLAAREVVNWLWDDPPRIDWADWPALIFATGVFMVVRSITRPILLFLTCPLQLITLGLFIFVINALILLLTDLVCDWLGIRFFIDGFWTAFVAALIISAVSFAMDRLVRRNVFGRP